MTKEPRVAPPADVVAVAPAAVRRVIVTSEGARAELTRAADGSWTAGAGTSRVSATLMADVEGRLFPLQAYRSLAGDTASAEFGLVDPEITFTVEDRRGREHRVLLGAATYTNGGVYARKGTTPGRLYLVPRRMMDDLRSLVAGRRIDAPNDLPEQLQEKTPRHDGISWWLRQVLDAGGATGGGAR
jgi:hypothetical protein